MESEQELIKFEYDTDSESEFPANAESDQEDEMIFLRAVLNQLALDEL